MLTKEQKIILKEIFNSKICDISTWGGGTALSEIYLKHRKSEDIDIILSDLPPTIELTILSNKIKQKLNAVKKKAIIKLNRFQYIFELSNNNQYKLEFVYYPFIKLTKPKKIGEIKTESLIDIAVSKTLAAYQRKEIKDTYDLFIILYEKYFTLDKLIKGVEKKFGEEIDSGLFLAKLMANLNNFQKLRPMLIKKYPKKLIANFFQDEFNKFLKRQKF